MHPNYHSIIVKLRSKQPIEGPWGMGITHAIETGATKELVEQLASQAKDDPTVMTKIVGLEITELLLNRKLRVW